MNAWIYALLQATVGASSPIPQVRIWHLRQQGARQANMGEQMRMLLNEVEPRIGEYLEWLLEGSTAWDAISTACGQRKLEAFAVRLKLDTLNSSFRDVILTGLSTVATYGMTWDMLLGSTMGLTRKNLLAIRQIEDAVNRIVQNAFSRAFYFYRGLSIVELEAICLGKTLPGLIYSFVSMSVDPTIAMRFAFSNSCVTPTPHVVLAIDAYRARMLGAVPALYSLASDILNLPASAESVNRTFQMQHATELQTNFSRQWPSASSTMAKAILTVLETPPYVRYLAKELRAPCLSYQNVFSPQ